MIRPTKRMEALLASLDEWEERTKTMMHNAVVETAERVRDEVIAKAPTASLGKLQSLGVKEISGLHEDEVGAAVVGETAPEYEREPEYESRFKGAAHEFLSSEFGLNGKAKRSIWIPAISRAVREVPKMLPALHDESVEWTKKDSGGSISSDGVKAFEPFQKALGIQTKG